MSNPTINDVARLAGVSIKTVSRVVNGEPNVGANTRARVEAAIAELKYRPNPSARSLAARRSHQIALVYDDPEAYEIPSAGYVINMQQGALSACKKANYELLIHPCNYRDKKLGAELKAFAEHFRPAGIILAAPLSNMPQVVRAIEDTGIPMVRISPGKAPRMPCIATNDREISSQLTQYLASLGHKRIAFITGHKKHAAVANRFRGYQDGLRESGLKFSERLVAEGDNSIGSGEAAAMALLERKHRPTAIFAANDDMAGGVYRAANRLGLNIPGQLSVAGFDDISLARQLYPALTTIRQPLEAMTARAATMLIEESKNGVDGTEILPATLQIRDSTGPAPS